MMAWALFCHDFDLSKGINILSEKCPVVLDHYIYTKDHCPFSKRVKEYLTSEKVDFKQIRVDDDPKTYDELKKKTNLQTVPQVFVDGKFIGSATDFFAWIDS
jgi:glutaredoxin 3